MSLWAHPPATLSRRWMECLGGTDAARAATLLNHAVFADPEHTTARQELAGVHQRLGISPASVRPRMRLRSRAFKSSGPVAETQTGRAMPARRSGGAGRGRAQTECGRL